MLLKRRLVWQASGLWGLFVVAASATTLPQVSAHPLLVSQQFSWSDLWGSLRRPRTNKGGKGELCLLVPAPIKPPDVIWHNRPLFVWQGLEQTIGLRRAGSEIVFWRRSLIQPGTVVNQIQYSGLPLQPGQTYELLLYSSPAATQPVRWQAFTIMGSRDRVPVTTALQALTAKLQKENASEETIAQQRAQYFSDHHLQADVLQEVYGVKNPSVALQQFATDLSKQFCSSP
ncbi:MAG: hypothetical protein ACAF41_34405 (plasmid) [Leptolyngbya sp. BL-A-14]